ncbi:MAG: Type secretion system protein subtype b [Pseudomonadota bacterium]
MTRTTTQPTSAYVRKTQGALVIVGVFAAAIIAVIGSAVMGFAMEQKQTLADLDAAIKAGQDTSGAGGSPLAQEFKKRVFTATNSADFQSQLQARIKVEADKSGITVDSMQVMRTERIGGLSRITIRLDGVVPQSNLGRFLKDLASGAPAVLIHTFELRPAQQLANRLNNGGISERSLQARFDFTAVSPVATAPQPGARP